jgi:hypothetical protein
MPLTDKAPEFFRADLDRLNKAVQPFVVTFEDGWKGIVGAPEALSNLYARLCSHGYANGWMT